ncbi:HTH-type transcriptional regulator YhaJ [Methylorubrum aminovorans]|nr:MULTISPECIES: LysR family transcriptional regulator [unclassified Methylobacterium]QIJ76017.1 LysR family transcriptional regulator [Methylobacterium sp. CLZ]QIJ80919.1 LysR family transcriptional regulator [Methylobacterium sp. NI91]
MIGSLTLDQLRVLVTIAETGSFSAAGRRLQRAQSAISQTVATLEGTQGVKLFDRSGHRPRLTEVGRALVGQARLVLSGAGHFEAMAAGTRDGVEPELAVAIDPMVPTAPLIKSLRALRDAFPHLAVSFSTEGLGGAERRLRRGDAALAFCILLPSVPDDLKALPLLSAQLLPVVASGHPLAGLGRAATRADLEEHVQLVLSDPSAPDGPCHGILGTRTWRFVDLSRRLDFLLAGLGWCRMPEHLVAPFLADGRLVALAIDDDPAGFSGPLMIYAAHLRERSLGRAGRWLLGDLQARFDGPSDRVVV